MKVEMDGFSGQVKRDLSERKFNSKDEQCCRTGGRVHGCPFFRLSGSLEWVCTLYRLSPQFNNRTKRYKRANACLKNKEPPTKKRYFIHYTTGHICEVVATSKEEAHEISSKSHKGSVENIEEGDVVEYENLV